MAIQFAKCPRCNYDLSKLDEKKFCPNCGMDLADAARKTEQALSPAPTSVSTDLARPLRGFWYVVLGLAWWYIPPAIFLAIGYSLFSGDDSFLILGIASLAWLILSLHLATKAYYGKVSFNCYLNVAVVAIIPLVNWWVVYHMGKGAYMLLSQQELPYKKTPSRAGLITLIVYIVLAIIISGLDSRASPVPSPTSAPRPTPNYANTVRAIATKTALAQPACLEAGEVTSRMAGQTVCVYGIVARTEGCDVAVVNTIGGCRIRFGPPDTFFFASGTYVFYDVEPGDCVTMEGPILLSSEGVPYIDVYDTLYNCTR